MSNRHNVFISYHHKNDEAYKIKFERLFSSVYDILETKAVIDGDIDPYIRTETIRQKIRDEFIRSASVTVVLKRISYPFTKISTMEASIKLH